MAFYKDDSQVYRVPELDEMEWLVHGFGTRQADVPGLFANLATLKQIHSATCVEAGGRGGVLGEGDALLEDTLGAVVAVKTADCIPILLVDERRRAVAAVHAGWRGTVAGIAAGAAATMSKRFGTRVEDLHAAIGPGIGKCCYEVGPEVAAQFGLEGRTHLDLPGINRARLGRNRNPGRPHLRQPSLHHVPGTGVPLVPAGQRGGRASALLCGSPAGVTVEVRRVNVHVDLPAMRARSSAVVRRVPRLQGEGRAGCPGCPARPGAA